jgi:hypothetical protein
MGGLFFLSTSPNSAALSVAYDKCLKALVTERALVKRLQRFLQPRGEYLRTATSKKQKRWGLGRYYLQNTKGVINKNVNIEKLARDLRVLRPREEIE